MTKKQYRDYFLSWQNDIKLTKQVESVGFNRNTFSLFLNGNDDVLSLESLEKIKKEIENVAKGILSKEKDRL